MTEAWNGRQMIADNQPNDATEHKQLPDWDASKLKADGLGRTELVRYPNLLKTSTDMMRYIFSKSGKKVRLDIIVATLKLASLACQQSGELDVPAIVEPPASNPAEGVPVVGPALDYIDEKRQEVQRGLQALADSGAEGTDNTLTSYELRTMILSSTNESMFPIDSKDYFVGVCPPGFRGGCRIRSAHGFASLFTIAADGELLWVKQVTQDGITVQPGEQFVVASADSGTFADHKLSNTDETIFILGLDPIPDEEYTDEDKLRADRTLEYAQEE